MSSEPTLRLVDRLRGKYVIPVNDGAGLLNGSDVFKREFPTPPIHKEAADRIEALEADLERASLALWETAQMEPPLVSEYADGLMGDEPSMTALIRRHTLKLVAEENSRLREALSSIRTLIREGMVEPDGETVLAIIKGVIGPAQSARPPNPLDPTQPA